MVAFFIGFFATFFCWSLYLFLKGPSYKVGDILILDDPCEEFEVPVKILITAVGKKKYQYKYYHEQLKCYGSVQTKKFHSIEFIYTKQF